jgi:hypothetical protein
LCNLDGRTNWRNGWQRGTRRTSPITEHGKAADQFPYAAANQYNDSTAYQYHNRAAYWFDDTRCGSRIKFTYNHSDSAANQHSTVGIGEHSPPAGHNARQFALHSYSGVRFNRWHRFAEQSEFTFNVILKSGKRSREYPGDIAIESALSANGWQRHISEVEIWQSFRLGSDANRILFFAGFTGTGAEFPPQLSAAIDVKPIGTMRTPC